MSETDALMEQYFIVDAHVHLGHGCYGVQKPAKIIDYQRIDGLMNWMSRYHVSMAAVSAIPPMVYRVWKTPYGGNEEVMEAMRRHPDKMIGLWVPNVFEEADIVKKRIDEAVEVHGFKGMKLHPWVQAFPANHPIAYPVFEAAAKHRLPVEFHSGTAPYTTPLLIADVAMRFPEVPVIMGHMGKHDMYHDAIPAARLSDNVYLEFSGNVILAQWEKAVKELGPHRLLFGTDGGNVAAYFLSVMDLEVSEEVKRMILGENALNLFRLKPHGGIP